MDVNIELLVNNILEINNFQESESSLVDLLINYPEHCVFIIKSLTQLYKNNGYKLREVEVLVLVYSKYKNDKILDIIETNYSNTTNEMSKSRYDENIIILNKRNFVYTKERAISFEKLTCRPIFIDNKFIIAKVNDDIVKYEFKRYEPVFKEGNVYLLKNELSIKNLRIIHGATHAHSTMPNYISPLYLYYDENLFNIFMQVVDLGKISDNERYVFIVGRDCFIEFFSNPQVRMPEAFFSTSQEEVNIVREIKQNMLKDVELAKERIVAYYTNSAEKIKENIRNGKPSILFWTSIFSTAVQYHTRDTMECCKELGCEVGVVKEISFIHSVNYTSIIEIDKLKPDIIFIIGWFRKELYFIPDEVFFITWIQDGFPKFYQKDLISSLRNNDIILNHFFTSQKLKDAGYNPDRMIDAFTPANHLVYKPYVLSEAEIDNYSCDVCIVGNVLDFDSKFNDLLNNIGDSALKKVIHTLFDEYAQDSKGGELKYHQADLNNYITDFFRRKNINLSPALFEELLFLTSAFNYRIFRVSVVDWIIDSGITNIKLWGNGWNKGKYAKYSMGFAQNGVELSKIYQSSKIVIGINPIISGATRAWESILSGTFYLGNYIPPESDYTDIRKVLKENDEIVIYKGKDDLIKKINYYLEHEDERAVISEKARKAALEKGTYLALMSRVLQNLKSMCN